MEIVAFLISLLISYQIPFCENSANQRCLQCIEGYIPSIDQSECLACPPNCNSCFLATNNIPICYKLKDACGIPNCLTCDVPTQDCTACNDGYVLLDPDTCSACAAGCRKCETNLICDQCFDPSATKNAQTCTCPAKTFFNTVSHTCAACLVHCTLCKESGTPGTSRCTQCDDNYYPDATGVCQQCPALCKTCHFVTPNPVCDSCNAGSFLLINKSCQTCNSNCLSCVNFQNTDAPQCTQCNTGFIPQPPNGLTCICQQPTYFYNNACKNCDPTCKTCDPLTGFCQTCSDTNATPANLQCICNQGYYPSTNTCVKCGIGCTACTDANTCTNCVDTNAHASGGKCVCNDNTKYMLNNGMCAACGINCQACNNAGDDTSLCTKCIGNNFIIIGPNCQCDKGFFFVNNLCSPCDSTCATCSNVNNEGVCITCVDTNAFPSNTVCTCNKFYTQDPVSKACIPCPSFCATCTLNSGNAICSTCGYPNMIVDAVNNVCKCINSFYQVTDHTCHPCQTNCAICTKSLADDTSVCTTCTDPNMIVNADQSCACNNGFFPVGTACSLCQSDCTSCHNDGTGNPVCDKCTDPNAFPQNKGCVCSPKFYKSGNNCLNCPTGCNTCLLNTVPNPPQVQCQSCIDSNNMYLDDSLQCQCKGANFFNTKTLKCVPCGVGCAKCTNNNDAAQTSTCLACNDPHASPASPSLTDCACNDGYFLNLTVCIQCTANCAICVNKGGNGFCNKCNDGHALPNDNGVCTCVPGRYLVNGQCMPCPDTCVSCPSITGSPICDFCVDSNMIIINDICQCKNSFYLLNEACLSCPARCSSCVMAPGNNMVCTECTDPNMITTGSDCACNSKFYNFNNTCYACPSSCDVCNQIPTEIVNPLPVCTICHDKENMMISNSTCVCIAGFFQTSANMCKACGFKCSKCSNQNDLPYCLACETGGHFTNVNGSCVCTDGFYLSGDICVSCPTENKCSACTNDPTLGPICTRCIDSEAMTINSKGACVCKNHYYLNNVGDRCLMCSYPCYQCVLSQTTQLPVCTSCSDSGNMALTNGVCSCLQHKFITTDKTKCIECPVSCSACAGDTSNNPICSGCVDVNMLLGVNCQKCSSYYYMSQSMLKCISCPDTCTVCVAKPNDQPSCTECRDKSKMIYDSNGICICKDTTYFSKLKTCEKCEERCNTCTDFGHEHCINCNTAITYIIQTNSTCDCDTSHKWSDVEHKCKINHAPNNLIIIIIATVVGLIVLGLIFYVMCVH